MYRLAVLFTPCMREYLLRARARLAPMYQVQAICRKFKLGDWFILYQLGKNIDPMIFREFMAELHKKMEDSESF